MKDVVIAMSQISASTAFSFINRNQVLCHANVKTFLVPVRAQLLMHQMAFAAKA